MTNIKEIEESFISKQICSKLNSRSFSENKWQKLWGDKVYEKTDKEEDYKVLKQKIELVFIDSDGLDKEQQTYLRTAYWAIRMFQADTDDKSKVRMIKRLKEFLYFIILDIGISPFVKIYEGKSLLFSLVQAEQFDLLEELVNHTYELKDQRDKDKFQDSFKVKDDHGNDIYHHVFLIKNVKNRNKFLKILFSNKIKYECINTSKSCCNRNIKINPENGLHEEQIGELEIPNNFGIYPHENDHDFLSVNQDDLDGKNEELNELCKLNEQFMNLFIQQQQADYCLVVETGKNDQDSLKINFIQEKLIQFKFEKNIDFFIFNDSDLNQDQDYEQVNQKNEQGGDQNNEKESYLIKQDEDQDEEKESQKNEQGGDQNNEKEIYLNKQGEDQDKKKESQLDEEGGDQNNEKESYLIKQDKDQDKEKESQKNEQGGDQNNEKEIYLNKSGEDLDRGKKSQLIEQGEDTKVFILIKFSTAKLDEIADKIQLQCELKIVNSKTKFNSIMKDDFLAWSEREKFNLINHFLYDDFQIDQLIEGNFIKEFYPLHKINDKRLAQNFEQRFKLFKSLFFGYGWEEHLDVICVYKRLLGEKYAYFIFFLESYNAFLVIPGLIGLVLFIHQMVTPEIEGIDKNDSGINVIYAIIIAIWSTWFVESWKKKQEYLRDSWSQDQLDDLENINERKGKYKYEQVYDSQIKKVMPMPKRANQFVMSKRWVLLIVLVLLSWSFQYLEEYYNYEAESQEEDDERDLEALINEQQVQETINNYVVNYHVVILFFAIESLSQIQDYLLPKILNELNFRYVIDYQNEENLQTFLFSLVSSYVSLFFIAFYRQSFSDLFSALFAYFCVDIFNILPLKYNIANILESCLKFVKHPCKSWDDTLGKEWETYRKLNKDNDQVFIFNKALKQEIQKQIEKQTQDKEEVQMINKALKQEIQKQIEKQTQDKEEVQMINKALKQEIQKQIEKQTQDKQEVQMIDITLKQKTQEKTPEKEIERIVPYQFVIIFRQLEENKIQLLESLQIDSEFPIFVEQFGMISLFSTTFTLGCCTSFLVNMFYSSRLVTQFRNQKRAMPEFSRGIGSFLIQLEFYSFVSIIVNTALIIYTSARTYQLFLQYYQIDNVTFQIKGFIFILFCIVAEHILFFVKFLIKTCFLDKDNKIKQNQEVKRIFLEEYQQKLDKKLKSDGEKNESEKKEKEQKEEEKFSRKLKNFRNLKVAQSKKHHSQTKNFVKDPDVKEQLEKSKPPSSNNAFQENGDQTVLKKLVSNETFEDDLLNISKQEEKKLIEIFKSNIKNSVQKNKS